MNVSPVRPRIGRNVFIASTSFVAGEVVIGDDTTIMHHVMIRGDVAAIRIGARVNIQDGTIVHTKTGVPLDIADEVAVGHRAVVHCRRVGRGTLIGIGAIVLDDAEIGEGCIIGAAALVPPGMRIPSGKVVMGVPGKIVRDTTEADREYVRHVIDNYIRLAGEHAAGRYPNAVTLGCERRSAKPRLRQRSSAFRPLNALRRARYTAIRSLEPRCRAAAPRDCGADAARARRPIMSTSLTYLGHSGFVLESAGVSLAIDPFLTGNPVAKHMPADIKVQHLCVTHGHADHIGDTVAIGRANHATLYAAFEICEALAREGLAKCEAGNPGGKIKTDFGYVAFTQAFHSSSVNGRYMGQPTGIVVHLAAGPSRPRPLTFYHCGDTGLFSDMKLLGELYKPDVAMIPCGDRYTMGPELACLAAEFIRPRVAIPMHYNTFPPIAIDIAAFKPAGVEVKVLKPGETWRID